MEKSLGSGMEILAADVCERFCAMDNCEAGVQVLGGVGVTIRKLTTALNGEDGVYAIAPSAFTGEVVDSIAWGNGGSAR